LHAAEKNAVKNVGYQAGPHGFAFLEAYKGRRCFDLSEMYE
jgi:hypothetical protein